MPKIDPAMCKAFKPPRCNRWHIYEGRDSVSLCGNHYAHGAVIEPLTDQLKYCTNCSRRLKTKETPMPASDLTEIILVLDRSGSMGSCKEQTERGLNNFIAEQKGKPGRANLTLIQFDDKYEVVHSAKPIQQVEQFTLHPRDNTALHYAIGRAIDETGARLAATPEDQRPGLVIFAVMTDGLENYSHNLFPRYTKDKVATMVKHQEDVYSWKFVFLGANQNAVLTGGQLGFSAETSVTFDTGKSATMYGTLSAKVGIARGMSMAGQMPSLSYSEEDRKAIV